MAAPHVAGVAALVLSVNPNLTGKQVRHIIESTARKINDTIYDYSTTQDRLNGTWNNEMGYGLVDAYAAVMKALEIGCSTIPAASVTQNTQWSAPIYAMGIVNISSGVTLTITDTVWFTPEGEINVAPGAKLIIDGGTLTSACEGKLWQGITVLGDSNLPTSSAYQTLVQIKNGGKIENAITGITAINGGRVIATDAHFVNNNTGVIFEPIAPGQMGPSGSFNMTTFEINNQYFGNDFKTHIRAESSGSINVHGSNFLSTTAQNVWGKNMGIAAFDTYLAASQHSTMTPNYFEGFSKAIFASNTGSAPVLNINSCNFADNLLSIDINGINNLKLIKNNFNLTQENATGISVANATGYKIEENVFERTAPIPNWDTSTGVSIRNSGVAENEVYKNFYTNLGAAQVFSNRNSSQNKGNESEVTNTGLQTLCNTFNNTRDVDILVGTYPDDIYPSPHHSIREKQGSMQLSAGNLFYNNPVINIDNVQYQLPLYYYHGSSNIEIPSIVTSVTLLPADSTNICPAHTELAYDDECEEDPGKSGEQNGIEDYIANALSQYNKWNSEYEYWFAKLLAFEGDNEKEYNALLDMVFHYSALKDNYFNTIIVVVSGYYKSKMLHSLYKKLRFLFHYRNHYTDNLSIVETYLAENNYREALTTLYRMYEQFEMNEEQIEELNGLQTYIHWLQQLEEAGNSIYKLSENDLHYLVNYVETNTGRGTVFAHNILCGLYGICIEEAEGGRQKAEGSFSFTCLLSTTDA